MSDVQDSDDDDIIWLDGPPLKTSRTPKSFPRRHTSRGGVQPLPAHRFVGSSAMVIDLTGDDDEGIKKEDGDVVWLHNLAVAARVRPEEEEEQLLMRLRGGAGSDTAGTSTPAPSADADDNNDEESLEGDDSAVQPSSAVADNSADDPSPTDDNDADDDTGANDQAGQAEVNVDSKYDQQMERDQNKSDHESEEERDQDEKTEQQDDNDQDQGYHQHKSNSATNGSDQNEADDLTEGNGHSDAPTRPAHGASLPHAQDVQQVRRTRHTHQTLAEIRRRRNAVAAGNLGETEPHQPAMESQDKERAPEGDSNGASGDAPQVPQDGHPAPAPLFTSHSLSNPHSQPGAASSDRFTELVPSSQDLQAAPEDQEQPDQFVHVQVFGPAQGLMQEQEPSLPPPNPPSDGSATQSTGSSDGPGMILAHELRIKYSKFLPAAIYIDTG